MKDELIKLIVTKLEKNKNVLKDQFKKKHPINVARHFALDNLLPEDIAIDMYANFPKPRKMTLLQNFGELKLKYSHIKHTAPILRDMHFAIQDPAVIAQVEDITGIQNQIPDRSRIAGGVTSLLKGHYINPHLDNSHDIDRKYYRTVNLLYYVSPNWSEACGGNYELWDTTVESRVLVPSYFNRLVVMETNRTSWHAVNPVKTDKPRCCIFNYYFSPTSPEGEDYFHGAKALFFNPLFRPRPEQSFRRMFAKAKDTLFGRPW